MSDDILPPREQRQVQVQVNGQLHTAQIETRMLLSDFLRHILHLTGTHVGCEHGVCGACTVIFNGAPIRSCLMLAVQADGAEILTVEGLARADGSLHPIQQALRDCHGLQCGFCTPGFIMAIYAFLQDQQAYQDRHGQHAVELDDEAIREAVSGNLCRCTGYQGIVEAVRHLLAERQEQAATPATTQGGRA